MISCPSCSTSNREGTLYCEACGYSLTEYARNNATIPTRQVGFDPDQTSAKATWGSAQYQTGTAVILKIRDAAEPMRVEPSDRLVFGRSDASSSVEPDIDLAPYGALEKGVSRQHAVIEISEDTLMIMDVGSSNGTFLNGQRLVPNQPRVLRDGDEVRLGKLVTHVYFR